MKEMEDKKKNFFSHQPFWEVTKQREDSLLCMEDCEIRLLRYCINQGHFGLNCIPGVGQLGLAFSVQEKKTSAYVFGVLPEKKEIPMYGLRQVLMVQFMPGSFTLATGIPSDEIPPEGLELKTVFPWAVSVMESINQTDSEREHTRQLQIFMSQCRGKKAGCGDKEKQIAASIAAYMMKSRREIRMKELERYYGYTARTLQKLVVKNVGITPKQLNLQICLQSAIRQMAQENGSSLTELSQQLNFYDQSHFNRMFRKMTGFCPGEYLKWKKAGQTVL